MTDFETVARQKLYLAVDNGRRYVPGERIGYLAGLLAGVAFIYAVLWPLVCLIFSHA